MSSARRPMPLRQSAFLRFTAGMAENPLIRNAMTDILELNDPDFAQKMEGLVHEATCAMEGRSPSSPEAQAPAGAPAAIPEIHAPEPLRHSLSLPELLRPIVQGVQAVGRVTGVHTEILSRLDKNAADAAATPA